MQVFATSYCYTCPKPDEFGHLGDVWDTIGWRVDVQFREFPRIVIPKDHLDVLRPLIEQEEFSPLRPNGYGLQHVYLTSISQTFAQVLLGLAGVDPTLFTQEQPPLPLIESELRGQQEWEDIGQKKIEHDIPTTTTRKALVAARVGQGLFKERVSAIRTSMQNYFCEQSHTSHCQPHQTLARVQQRDFGELE